MLGSDDLERLSRDVYSARRLHHAVHCGECGYNLRSLPYVGRCPECGNAYNARPSVRTGIYVAGEIIFPLVELIAAAFFLGFGITWIVGGTRDSDPNGIVFGGLFGTIGAIAFYLFLRRTARYLHFRRVAASIENDDM